MALPYDEQTLTNELMSPEVSLSFTEEMERRKIFQEFLEEFDHRGGETSLNPGHAALQGLHQHPQFPQVKLEKLEESSPGLGGSSLGGGLGGQPTFGMVLSPTAANISLRTSASITQATPTLVEAAAARPEVRNAIEKLVVELDVLFTELERLHQLQYEFFFNGGLALGDLHTRFLARIEAVISQLGDLVELAPLLPAELQRRDDMALASEILRRRILIYQNEYERKIQAPDDRSVITSLMVVKQPFPGVVLQQQQLISDSLEVQLFSGVEQTVLDGGEVEASLLGDSISSGARSKKRKTHLGTEPGAKMLENAVHKMNNNVCALPIKFLLSSEKKVCNLKFTLKTATITGNPVEIESEPSQPLFILCHQVQFAPCEGELLKKEVFGGNITPVSWSKLANCLQRQFVRTIRQAERGDESPRALSMLDVCYIHQKRFEGVSRISITMFDKFWAWYGKFLHMFRYQRHIAKMWIRGLIFPFIGRETAEFLLGNKPGTFLLRPSDAFPGQLVISYISPMGAVQHYLVSHTDVTPKSLASFILEKNLLSLVLQFDFKALENAWMALAECMGGLQEVPAASSLSVTAVPKTAVFSEFVRPKAKGSQEKEEDEESWRYQRDPAILSTGLE